MYAIRSYYDFMYEAHVYFDSDASGRYLNDYDSEGAYPEIAIDKVNLGWWALVGRLSFKRRTSRRNRRNNFV